MGEIDIHVCLIFTQIYTDIAKCDNYLPSTLIMHDKYYYWKKLQKIYLYW